MLIRTQIESCLHEVTASDDRITATACFGSDFIGFQGHFPENPVLPGMCLLETIMVLIRRLKGTSVRMKELVTTKFICVVLPDQTVTVDCMLTGNIVVAHIKTETERIAQIKMKVAYA